MKYFTILLIANFVFFGCDTDFFGSDTELFGSDTDLLDIATDFFGSDTDLLDIATELFGSDTDDVAELCLEATPTGDAGYRIITNQEELQAIGNDQNTLAAHYVLCEDIEIDLDTFAQINPNTDTDNDSSTFDGTEFTGIFDGNDKTISNLKIEAAQSDYVGLFGKIGMDGEVRDLTLSLAGAGGANDPDISGISYVGALAGENEGIITNVGVTGGYVNGTGDNVGGLIGYNNGGGTIEESYATGDVRGNEAVGGLIGSNNYGAIEESYTTGAVTGNSQIGGLVGYNNSDRSIKRSYATGSIEGNEAVGGLVGHNDGGRIEKSYATAAVTVTGASSRNIGGLVGENNGSVEYSYAIGTVTGDSSSERIGGLVGDNYGSVEYSYAAGRVTGSSDVGGLVGENNDDGGIASIITASYFDATPTGTPTGQSQDAVGTNQSTNSPDVTPYYTYTDPNNGETRVYTEADGAGDLIAQGNFLDWDDTIWTWQEGQWPTF